MNEENKLSGGANKSSIGSWAKKHKFLSAIIIIFVIIIIGNAFGSDKENNSPNNKLEGEQVNAEQKTETKLKEWASVFKIEANSDKQTENFSLHGGQQKVIYKNTGDSYSLCIVYVVKEGDSLEKSGGFPVVSITGNEEDETMMRKTSGEYYLDLKTANGTCSVEVQELR